MTNSGKLSNNQKEKLDVVSRWKEWTVNTNKKKSLSWDDKYEIYVRAVNELGDKFIQKIEFEGVKIGAWEGTQMSKYKGQQNFFLSPEEKLKLDKIPRWREWREEYDKTIN